MKEFCCGHKSEQALLKKYLDCVTSFGRLCQCPETKKFLTEETLEIFSRPNCLNSDNTEVVATYVKVFYNFFIRFKKLFPDEIILSISELLRSKILNLISQLEPGQFKDSS